MVWYSAILELSPTKSYGTYILCKFLWLQYDRNVQTQWGVLCVKINIHMYPYVQCASIQHASTECLICMTLFYYMHAQYACVKHAFSTCPTA